MEFGVLGHVEVRIAGQEADAGHSRQRAVLAVLLLSLGRAVSPELLIDRVWGESPPASVRSVLYSYVAKLRQVIADAADPDVQLARSSGGYLLQAGAGQLDLHRFRRLIADAANADGEQAAAMLREALGLWRGPALAGLDSPWLRTMRDTLELERTTAMLDLNDARLRLGQHATLVSELSGQTAASPASERLAGQLMLALYRSGRQAEALRLFDQTRRHLADELGADPGPELRSLHQRILRADPSVAAPGPVGPGPMRIASAPVPRELPPDVPAFTGRAAELTWLGHLIGAGTPGTVVISAIGGTAGIGKTALALHWAHQVAHQFPDGQLHVNLHGFDSSRTPAAPAEAVRGFLGALGVPPERIPPSADTQAALYRSLLAERKMLIVLDNARDEQQVRPLLPASPASLVIITSRNQFAGLAAADGARLLSLDLLPHGEAVQLLTARIGDARAAAEPGATDEIATLCACLPLALAIAASRAAARPAFPLAALAAELRDMRDRLDVLDTRDPVTSVRTVFSCSYDNLRAPAARMFRLLGLHPGPDISAHAAASLSGISIRQAQRALGELTKSHLLNEHAPGRYAFHDLLRAYAAEQADADESSQDRRAAIHRMLDHYLHTAHAAALLRDPAREPLTLDLPQPGTTPEQMTDERQALAWFETEHRVLAAAISLAASSGFGTHAWQLAWALGGFLDRHGYWQECYAISATAMTAAARLHDLSGQARIHRESGFALLRLGRYQDARAHLRQALDLFAQLGDRSGQARAQLNIGATFAAEGNYDIALEHAGQALELLQGGDQRTLLANALNNIGWYHIHLGDFQQAISYCLRSLDVHRGSGNGADGEAAAWGSLGYAHHHLGHYAEAIDHYEHALRIYLDFASRYEEAGILTGLGDAQQALDSPAAARGSWQRALTILENLHHPDAKPVRAKLCALDAQSGASRAAIMIGGDET